MTARNVLQVGRKGSHQHLAHLVTCIGGSEKREERQERWTVLGFCFNPIFYSMKYSSTHHESWGYVYPVPFILVCGVCVHACSQCVQADMGCMCVREHYCGDKRSPHPSQWLATLYGLGSLDPEFANPCAQGSCVWASWACWEYRQAVNPIPPSKGPGDPNSGLCTCLASTLPTNTLLSGLLVTLQWGASVGFFPFPAFAVSFFLAPNQMRKGSWFWYLCVFTLSMV